MVDFNMYIDMPDSFVDWQPNFSGFNGIFNTPDSPATSYQENIDFKILEIQNQIQKTFDFCEKVLKAKYESLLAELRNFILNNDTKAVAHIPPSSVEFVTNLFNIKACITETFGYLNISSLDLNQLGYGTDFNKQSPFGEITQLNFNQLMSRIPLFRSKMTLKEHFGGTGLYDNRFTEPNGLTIDKDNNIIVADSNSNFIKVFEANGTFRFKFGIEKLLFPNKVACHKPTGNIVIIERKPAHEIKLFDKNGEFIRRFGSGLLKSPRGVCIDAKSRIVVLESKVMRILIFTMEGRLVKAFDVSKYFKFANSICTSNDAEKIFISDNHSHCIRVFDYDGNYLQEMGGPGLTNYPTSVDMNTKNQLVVTDNYNSFNLTVLSEEGSVVGAFESKMKHSKILDVVSVDDRTIMFSSRDNNIYIYNY